MNIVVLAGGTSTERAISIVSGREICKALRKRGHRAILADIFCGLPDSIYGDEIDAFPETYDVEAAESYMHLFDGDIPDMASKRRVFFGPHILEVCSKADIVFLGLHGANGEDGRVQATFDLLGIRYTGTGYLSSALAMDKSITKQLFRVNHVPTPKSVMAFRWQKAPSLEEAGLSFPVVVKTCCGGSSVGVYIVHDEAAYQEALHNAYVYEDAAIVEEYIKGREFSVAVVDGKAYPVIEIEPLSGFYDYKNKYSAGSTIETCPAKLTPEETARMQAIAEAGAKALGLEAYSRFDFMMSEDGGMYCLEANTLPGMTPTSLIPQEARALGMDFQDLCEELIRVSLKKYRKNREPES